MTSLDLLVGLENKKPCSSYCEAFSSAIPYSYEMMIANADLNDDIEDINDVTYDDDFDSDGFINSSL